MHVHFRQIFLIIGDIGISISGLSFTTVYQTLGQGGKMEYDLILKYSGEVSDLGYFIGVKRYDFIHDPANTPVIVELCILIQRQIFRFLAHKLLLYLETQKPDERN
ncbi:MAG: hypothetical protein JKY87_05810 [Mariprofundus sp.]|nr:hypothetical protein [Mariprofundus sp.]